MRIIKKAFYTIVLLLLTGVIFVHFLPVSWDAGGCAGGFKTYIYSKSIDELASLYAHGHNEYKTVSAVKEVPEYEVSWEGRTIYLNAVFDTIDNEGNQDTIVVEYAGRRYWTEKYSWKESDSEKSL